MFTLLPSREQQNGWKSHQGRAAAPGDDIVYMNGNMKPQPKIDGTSSALEIILSTDYRESLDEHFRSDNKLLNGQIPLIFISYF